MVPWSSHQPVLLSAFVAPTARLLASSAAQFVARPRFPRQRTFYCRAKGEDAHIVELAPHDLQSDRTAVAGRADRHRRRRQTGEVGNGGERRAARTTAWHSGDRCRRIKISGERRGCNSRAQKKVKVAHEAPHLIAQLLASEQRRRKCISGPITLQHATQRGTERNTLGVGYAAKTNAIGVEGNQGLETSLRVGHVRVSVLCLLSELTAEPFRRMASNGSDLAIDGREPHVRAKCDTNVALHRARPPVGDLEWKRLAVLRGRASHHRHGKRSVIGGSRERTDMLQQLPA